MWILFIWITIPEVFNQTSIYKLKKNTIVLLQRNGIKVKNTWDKTCFLTLQENPLDCREEDHQLWVHSNSKPLSAELPKYIWKCNRQNHKTLYQQLDYHPSPQTTWRISTFKRELLTEDILEFWILLLLIPNKNRPKRGKK